MTRCEGMHIRNSVSDGKGTDPTSASTTLVSMSTKSWLPFLRSSRHASGNAAQGFGGLGRRASEEIELEHAPVHVVECGFEGHRDLTGRIHRWRVCPRPPAIARANQPHCKNRRPAGKGVVNLALLRASRLLDSGPLRKMLENGGECMEGPQSAFLPSAGMAAG
jgi:hypothetical protein